MNQAELVTAPESTGRTMTAVLLQCLPVLALGVLLLDLLTGGGMFMPRPDDSAQAALFVAWILGFAMLLSGAGYLAIGRLRRALVCSCFGACNWIWFDVA